MLETINMININILYVKKRNQYAAAGNKQCQQQPVKFVQHLFNLICKYHIQKRSFRFKFHNNFSNKRIAINEVY